MKPRIIFFLLILIFPAFFITGSLLVPYGAATPMDKDEPQPDERIWDFNPGGVIGWRVNDFRGSRTLVYNITDMYLYDSLTGIRFYTVALDEMYYDLDAKELKKYEDPINHPRYNASLLNYTTNAFGGTGIMLPCYIWEMSQNIMFANPFIPKNSSDQLDLHWCALRLQWFYNLFMNITYPKHVGSDIYVNTVTNEIRFYNNTEGSYVNLTYYDNGTLERADLNLGQVGPSTYERVFNFIPHGLGNYWDFSSNEIIAWKFSANTSGKQDLYYNISAFDRLIDPIGNGYDYDAVLLKQMYFNTTLELLREFTNLEEHPMVNSSLINYLQNSMYPWAMSEEESMGIITNPFVPKNSSDVLDLHWCASAMFWIYAYFLTNGSGMEQVEFDVYGNTIHYNSPANDTYATMTYYDNGTLEFGSMIAFLGGSRAQLNYTRLFDFNPIDEIVWDVKANDTIYFCQDLNQTRFDVLNITTTTQDVGMSSMTYQQIWANMSYWDYELEEWTFDSETVIGAANEDNRFIMGDDDTGLPIIFPVGTKGSDIGHIIEVYLPYISEFDGVSYGDDWIKFTNSSTHGWTLWKLLPNGFTKYIYSCNMSFFGTENFTESMIYLQNNINLEDNSETQINFEPYDIWEMQVAVDIATINSATLLYSAFPYNPTNTTANNAFMFLDLLINDTNSLNQIHNTPINVTVNFNQDRYKNLEVWWFNMSGNEINGTWVQILANNPEEGVVTFSVNHTSVFVVNGTIINLPGPFSVSTDAGNPDTNGIYNLNWTLSEGADNYSIYYDDEYISEISGTLLGHIDDIEDLGYEFTILNDAIFYYRVVAFNQTGNVSSSNCIKVTIKLPPGAFALETNATTPDSDGTFLLNWTVSPRAKNYTVYYYPTFIFEFNNSLIEILSDIEKLNYTISDRPTGTYYYIVVAFNEIGNISSNCIKVVVLHPPGPISLTSNAGTPADRDGTFTITWNSSIDAANYSIYFYNKIITELNDSILLCEGLTNSSYDFEKLLEGKYYFVILAVNIVGNRSSNMLEINVTYGKPEAFVLNPIIDLPDRDGIFLLTWSECDGAVNFTVFGYDDQNILVFTKSNITTLSCQVSGINSGTYTFMVKAFNDYGNSSSNTIGVIVDIPESGDDDDDNKKEAPTDIISFITSPLGIGLMVGSAAAVGLIVIIYKKKTGNRTPTK